MLSCEICKIFKNTSLYGTPPMAASGRIKTSEIDLFRSLLPATETNTGFFPTFMMELLCLYGLWLIWRMQWKYLLIMAKTSVFINIFAYYILQRKKIDCLVQSKYIQLDVSDCHFCWKQWRSKREATRGTYLYNQCEQLDKYKSSERCTIFSALVCDCSVIYSLRRSFVHASVSRCLGSEVLAGISNREF